MSNRLRRLMRRRLSLASVALGACVLVPVVVVSNPLASAPARSGSRASVAAVAKPSRAVAVRSLRRRIEGTADGGALKAHLADAVVSEAATGLAVFARARSAADAVPANLLESLAPIAVDAAESRLAFASGGNSVYLVPDGEGICLVDTSGSESGCFRMSEVLSTGSVQSKECGQGLPNPQTIEIAGVIPNRVTEAAVVLSDGTKRPLTISGNAFVTQLARSGPLPTRIEVHTPTGVESFGSTVPPDTANEACVDSVSEYEALVASGKLPKQDN